MLTFPTGLSRTALHLLSRIVDFPTAASQQAAVGHHSLPERWVGKEALPPAFTMAGILLPGMPIPVWRPEGAVGLGGVGSRFPAADSRVVALPGRPCIDGADLRPATTGTADHPLLELSGEGDP